MHSCKNTGLQFAKMPSRKMQLTICRDAAPQFVPHAPLYVPTPSTLSPFRHFMKKGDMDYKPWATFSFNLLTTIWMTFVTLDSTASWIMAWKSHRLLLKHLSPTLYLLPRLIKTVSIRGQSTRMLVVMGFCWPFDSIISPLIVPRALPMYT